MTRFTTLPARALEPSYKRTHRVADSHIFEFERGFFAMVDKIKRAVSRVDIIDALARPEGLDQLLAEFDRAPIKKAVPEEELAALQRTYRDITLEGALAVVPDAEEQFGELPPRLLARLDVVNPEAVRFAEQMAGEMIREVTAESKSAIRALIGRAIREGVAPAEQAGIIERSIGLTERYAIAVENLRFGLFERGDSRANQLADRYAGRLLRDRASNIARTETMRAANMGQEFLWRQMDRDALINTLAFQREWIVTPDDRLCPRCAPLAGKRSPVAGKFSETQRGVLPSQRISVAGETVETPPLHPRCRCTMGLVEVEIPAVPAPAPPAAPTPGLFSSKMYDALVPKRGGWTTKTRAQTLAAVKAEGPDGRLLADTLSRFQNSGNITRMRTSVETHLAGGDSPQGRVLIEALRGVPSDQIPTTLHRGLSVKGTAEELLAQNPVGRVIDMNISSFSKDRKISLGFAESTQKRGMSKIMMRLEDAQSGLPIENFAPSRVFAEEREWITGGRFEVVSSKIRGDTVEMVIRQVATL